MPALKLSAQSKLVRIIKFLNDTNLFSRGSGLRFVATKDITVVVVQIKPVFKSFIVFLERMLQKY